MFKQIVLSHNGPYLKMLEAKTLKEAKRLYEAFKRVPGIRADTLERHYFRAKQRLLLGEVLMEDVIK